VILFACCVAGTGLSYYLGVRTPGLRGHGTTKGWAISLAIGLVLGALYYAFSAYGMMFSIDNLLDGL
jgi:hypothetical protein